MRRHAFAARGAQLKVADRLARDFGHALEEAHRWFDAVK